MRIRLRDRTADEGEAVEKLAHSRTAPARLVEPARIIFREGDRAAAIAGRLGLDAETVRKRIHRFNAEGLRGLEDRPRNGRPATYSSEQVAAVVAAALTAPPTLNLPFASWALDRLAAYLHEHRGIAIKRSRVDEALRKEGLRWRRQETWFGERVDPEFAEERGASKRPTPRRRPGIAILPKTA